MLIDKLDLDKRFKAYISIKRPYANKHSTNLRYSTHIQPKRQTSPEIGLGYLQSLNTLKHLIRPQLLIPLNKIPHNLPFLSSRQILRLDLPLPLQQHGFE